MPQIQNLLADITPADLTEFARAVPERADFALSTPGGVLPSRVIPNVKYRTRNRSITVAAARYRSFNAPTPRLRSSATTSVREGYLPPLGGLQEIEEFQVILDEIARGADDQRLLDALWDNVENQVLAIRARVELVAGDLLTDGIIEITENGQDLEADFGVPAEHKPTAAVLWSDVENARPLTDELAWRQVLADKGKALPDRVLTSLQVTSLFARSKEYRETYWGGEVSGTTRPSLTPEQVNSVRGTYGLPPITTYDVQIPVADDQTGAITTVRAVPANRFIMLPPGETLGESLYGLTAEGIALSMGDNPGIVRQDAPGIVASGEVLDNPVTVVTKTTAVALPVLHDPESYVTAQVLA